MKKHWIEYREKWMASPISYWVHREKDSQYWREATKFDPPLPRPIPGEGYSYYYVEIDGFTFGFASFAEIDHCITILSQKLLPTTPSLREARDTTLLNRHWLSRLPGKVKSWKYRQKAVKYLSLARQEFARELNKY